MKKIKNSILLTQVWFLVAWGRLRDPATHEVYAPGNEPTLFLGRGYTGHEHLTQFGLINMNFAIKREQQYKLVCIMSSERKMRPANARLYDPALGRFLSPDPYVQAPDFTQNFNRYSYCLNNPLVYTDPNGEFIFTALLPGVGVLIDAALWGAVIGGAGYTASVAFSDGGFNNWDWGQFGKSVGIGAISGIVTAGIGQAFGAVGSMGIGGEIARAYTHGFANGVISELSGGSFMQGFAAGGLGSLGGSAFMMYGGKFANSPFGTYTFSGIAGGAGAELTGGNFGEGAAIGLMTAGLNHLQQNIQMSQMDKLLAERISDAALAERQRNIYNMSVMDDPYGEFDQDINIDISVKGAKRFIKSASIGIGDKSVSADIYYKSSKNNIVRSFGWPRKQPSVIISPGEPKISGYLMFLHNSTDWNVVTLSFSKASSYNTFRNYILGY